MLFSEEAIRDPNDILRGWGSDPLYNPQIWSSSLPSLGVSDFFEFSDPVFSDFGIFSNSSEIDKLARYSVITAMRNCITRIGSAWGWYKRAIKPIVTIFKDLADDLDKVVEGLKTAMTAVSLAIDAISWVPVVGWILAIIKALVNLVSDIVQDVKDVNQAKRDARLRRQADMFGLPMSDWDPNIDTAMGRVLQRRLSMSQLDLQWAFMPRYPAKYASDFVAQQTKYKEGDDCFSGWRIMSKGYRTAPDDSKGLGFVPGTDFLHSTLQILTNRKITDNGEFMPVTRSTAGQLWGQTIKGDSGMTFAVDADKCATAWMEYISAAYSYGIEGMGAWIRVGGRTRKYASQEVPLDYVRSGFQYQCTPCDYGKRDCNKKKDGKWRSPDTGRNGSWNVDARDKYLGYLHKVFNWKVSGTHYLRPVGMNESDWLRTTAPVKALDNLYARQKAMIQSPTCMYLDDSTSADGSGQPRFRAMYKGGELHKLWDKCVRAMFESGDWKKIDYRDVIKGEEVDIAIRAHLSNQYRTTPEKFFNMENSHKLADAIAGTGKASLTIKAPNMKSVLGDPKPPEPPPLNRVGVEFKPQRAAMEASTSGSGASSSSKKPSSAPLLIGAAALGLLMLKK